MNFFLNKTTPTNIVIMNSTCNVNVNALFLLNFYGIIYIICKDCWICTTSLQRVSPPMVIFENLENFFLVNFLYFFAKISDPKCSVLKLHEQDLPVTNIWFSIWLQNLSNSDLLTIHEVDPQLTSTKPRFHVRLWKTKEWNDMILFGIVCTQLQNSQGSGRFSALSCVSACYIKTIL